MKRNDLEVYNAPPREQSVIDEYVKRAEKAQQTIPDIIENGCGFIPYDDMVVYMAICTPKLSKEELEGIDSKVLDVLLEGDAEGDITNTRLVLICKGSECKKDMTPGDRIAVRGHAYRITTPKGTFFSVREYDIIGRYA